MSPKDYYAHVRETASMKPPVHIRGSVLTWKEYKDERSGGRSRSK